MDNVCLYDGVADDDNDDDDGADDIICLILRLTINWDIETKCL